MTEPWLRERRALTRAALIESIEVHHLMAKSRPEKKPERKANGQLPLPTSQAPASATRVLPMDLKVGDRLADETGEWEVASRPYTSNAGENASVRVKKAGQPEVTEVRTWGAHERISVRRASAEEAKR